MFFSITWRVWSSQGWKDSQTLFLRYLLGHWSVLGKLSICTGYYFEKQIFSCCVEAQSLIFTDDFYLMVETTQQFLEWLSQVTKKQQWQLINPAAEDTGGLTPACPLPSHWEWLQLLRGKSWMKARCHCPQHSCISQASHIQGTSNSHRCWIGAADGKLITAETSYPAAEEIMS